MLELAAIHGGRPEDPIQAATRSTSCSGSRPWRTSRPGNRAGARGDRAGTSNARRLRCATSALDPPTCTAGGRDLAFPHHRVRSGPEASRSRERPRAGTGCTSDWSARRHQRCQVPRHLVFGRRVRPTRRGAGGGDWRCSTTTTAATGEWRDELPLHGAVAHSGRALDAHLRSSEFGRRSTSARPSTHDSLSPAALARDRRRRRTRATTSPRLLVGRPLTFEKEWPKCLTSK